jgi:hypothetical protein
MHFLLQDGYGTAGRVGELSFSDSNPAVPIKGMGIGMEGMEIGS